MTESVSMISVSLLLVAFGLADHRAVATSAFSKASSALQKRSGAPHKLLQPPQSAPVPSATHMDPPSLVVPWAHRWLTRLLGPVSS